MITTFLAVAAVLFLCGLFLGGSPVEENRISWVGLTVSAGAMIAMAVFATRLPGDAVAGASHGAWLGGGGVLLLGIVARFRESKVTAPIALGALAAYLAAQQGPMAIFGLIAAAAILSIIVGLPSGYAFMLTAAASAAIGRLADQPDHPGAASLGILCATTLAAAALVSGLVEKRQPLAIVCTLLMVAGGGWLIARGVIAHPIVPFLAAPIAGLAVHFILPPNETPNPISNILAALIWLGLATLSFATQRSLGMAICLLMGAGVPLVLGNPRAAGSSAALAGLVWYRLLRLANPDLAAGSDLSQFYLLTGLVLGAGLGAIAGEWRARVDGLKGVCGGVLWGFIVAAGSVLSQIVFDVKGLSGVLAGSGLGSMTGMPAKRPMTGLAVTAAIGGTSAALLDWTDKLIPDDRAGKVAIFVSSFATLAILAAALYLLQRKPKPVKAS